eukprot:9201535-Pyramimonas_sp.AAC.1
MAVDITAPEGKTGQRVQQGLLSGLYGSDKTLTRGRGRLAGRPPPLSGRAIMGSSAAAAAEAIIRLYAVSAYSPGAQFRFDDPLGKVAAGVCLPRHWGQDLHQRGYALDTLAWAECMAATET